MSDSQVNSIRDAIRNIGEEYTIDFESLFNLLKELNSTLFVSNLELLQLFWSSYIFYIKNKEHTTGLLQNGEFRKST
ncbi:hypothetical protein [Lentibacillus salicampi]|uniref:Uncharacterized protein n=1 Tax=Lentibacillus salicampi TaxID=175306 RepID=A0A4Y9A909_9BACI|nr:hypothetical protein [Lentibacillus salicampi]TFJ91742.1 hypothetical protein E4U82_15945 [Lentibacillus salicampi]